jgi:cell wall-associated NlpC family hydrolase
MTLKPFATYGLLILSILLASPAFSSPFRDGGTATTKSSVPDEKEMRDRILSEFARWEGVKYKLGGASKKGIDCSSLMQEIYHAAFADTLNTRLPRTTARQISHGVGTKRADLRPGDLVFFSMTRAERHVGVYIGDGEFIHASTSQGVKISSLQNDYWVKRYTTARRVIV